MSSNRRGRGGGFVVAGKGRATTGGGGGGTSAAAGSFSESAMASPARWRRLNAIVAKHTATTAVTNAVAAARLIFCVCSAAKKKNSFTARTERMVLRSTLAVAAMTTAMASAQQQAIPNAFFFPTFHNRPSLTLNGDARTDGGELIVAGPGKDKTGSVFFSEPFDLSQGFFAKFTLTVTQVENSGHEGIAFVVQREGQYAMGRGGADLGYAGLGEAVAVEFDTARDAKQSTNHVAVKAALAAGQKLTSEHGDDSGALEKIGALPPVERLGKPLTLHVEYDAGKGEIKVHVVNDAVAAGKRGPAGKVLVAGSAIGAIPGGAADGTKFYVGFTAATGAKSSARFAVTEWTFGALGRQGCVAGFTGPDCAITNEEAERWCKQRGTCALCAQDVYNCMWCVSKSECVVGTREGTAQCSGIVDEPGSCDGGLSLVLLWTFMGVSTTVFVLGLVLVRTLPKAQAFKAVALLVSTVLGGMAGMVLSYMIAACLVEVSASVLFATFFGVFFLFEGALVAQTLWTHERKKGMSRQLAVLGVANLWVVLAGLECFVLNKKLLLWLPESPKVLMYGTVAGAMTFCTVFSLVDICNEAYLRWHRRNSDTAQHFALHDVLDPAAWDEPSRRVLVVTRSHARTAVLLAASLLSGFYFGYMFGVLKIEEKQLFRAALAIRQEAVYTLPAGALIGGLSGLVLQIIEWPSASDWEIEKKLGHSATADLGDDL